MDNNPVLRGLSNLFSDDTLSSCLYTLVFLFCFYKLKKYTTRISGYGWFNYGFTAWLTVMILVVVVQSVQNFASFIRHIRFGNESEFKIELGDLVAIISSPLLITFLFTIYLWLSEYWKRNVKDIVKLMFIEGLFVFVITLSVMLFFQISLNGSEGILTAMATYIPASTGSAFAFMFYNYYLYQNKLKIQEKELLISRLQQQLSQSQLDALSSKINPHFLYNALNSIAGLATSDGLKTRSMAIALSKLFRYNINKEESNYVSVEDELEMVLTYLEIEKIRFGDRLQYSCSMPPSLATELIPRHLLQPLVENAVKHGGNADLLEIKIAIIKNERGIVLCVADNGKPFDQDFNPGYGIKSLYDKLDLLTLGNYEVVLENNPKQVCITIGDHQTIM